MTDFRKIKTAFADAGWTLVHTSKANGRVSSVYFERARSNRAFDTDRIRVSDHHLGCTVHGEPQGGNLTADFVLSDFADDTPATDFPIMAEDDCTIEVAANGYTPSDPEWAAELAEERARWA